jgi:hypothetical protein
MYQNVILPYLYKAQHVSGDTPAHYQEPKTALTASGFPYVSGCETCSWWTLSTVCTSNNHSRMENQRLSVQF